MFNFLLGVVVGIILATVGCSGIVQWTDSHIDKAKTIIKEETRK
jgi:hypothetical protein